MNPNQQDKYPRDVITKKKEELGGMGVFSFPKDLGAHSTLLIFKKYKYISPGVRGLNKASNQTLTREELGNNAILLPLPREIKDTFSIKISEFEQGMFGDAISQGGSFMSGNGDFDVDKIIANIGLPSVKNLVTTASGVLGAVASRGLGRLQKAAGVDPGDKSNSTVGGASIGALVGEGTNISTSIEAGAGAMSNPKQALYFQGVDLKRHTFSWTMAPTSPGESDTIRDITNIVRRNSLPSYTDVGPLKRAILNYPSTVDIYFFGIEQDYFLYYRTCMIDSLDFDYTSQGMTVLRGGKPAVVTMRMSLKEMDIHTAEDYGGKSDSIGVVGTAAGHRGIS